MLTSTRTRTHAHTHTRTHTHTHMHMYTSADFIVYLLVCLQMYYFIPKKAHTPRHVEELSNFFEANRWLDYIKVHNTEVVYVRMLCVHTFINTSVYVIVTSRGINYHI